MQSESGGNPMAGGGALTPRHFALAVAVADRRRRRHHRCLATLTN